MTIRPASKMHRLIAYHEAGHVVAHCKLLFGVSDVGICADGIMQECGRISLNVAKFEHHLWGLPLSSYPPETQTHAYNHMIATMAGPAAEARHSKKSFASVLLGHGSGDWTKAKDIAAWLGADIESAGKATQIFVRKHWHHIKAVADLIEQHGAVSGDDVARAIR